MTRRSDTGFTVASTLLLAALAVPAPSHAGEVRAELGDHADFSRLALILPDRAEATAAVEDCGLRVTMPGPVDWPIERLRQIWSSRLSAFGGSEDSRSLTAAIPCGALIHDFRERSMLIVDVGGPPIPSRKPTVPQGRSDAMVAAAEATPAPTPETSPGETTNAQATTPAPNPQDAPQGATESVTAPPKDPAPSRLAGLATALSPIAMAQAQPLSPQAAGPLKLLPPPAAATTPLPPSTISTGPMKVVATTTVTPATGLEAEVRASVESTLRQLERTPRPTPANTVTPTPRQPANTPPPIGLMDVAQWAGEDFVRTRDTLLQARDAAHGRARVEAQIALIRFLLARAMSEEGHAALDTAASLSPPADLRFDLRVLGDAFRALDGEETPDDNQFVTLRPATEPDHRLWQAVALAPTRWTDARTGLPIALRRLLDYPADLRNRLLTTLAEGADKAADRDALRLIVLEMITLDPKGTADGWLDYFRGRLAERMGTPDVALERYDAASALRHGPFARRAEVCAIELRRRLGQLDETGAIAALEALRYAWRGDDIETDVLAALGDAYARHGRTDTALDIFALLARRFGTTAHGRATLEDARGLLSAVVDRLEQSPSGGIEALTLQARHGRLIALLEEAGEPGDGQEAGSLRRRIAALLIRDGFTVEATRILQALIEKARGPRRAELGATLARLLIDDGRETDALEVLSGTGDADLDPALAERRALLRADALLSKGDAMLALDTVRGLTGPGAARMRARSLFAAGEWIAANDAFAAVRSAGGTATAEDVALYGLSAILAGKPDRLKALSDADRGRLAGTRWADLLDALAPPPPDDGPLKARTVERDFASVDALARLAHSWSHR